MTVRCLDNPNYHSISRTRHLKHTLKELLNDDIDSPRFLKRTSRLKKATYLNNLSISLEKSQKELQFLEGIVIPGQIDQDTILNMINELKKKEIKQLQFEIKEGNIHLILEKCEQNLIFRLQKPDGEVINRNVSSLSFKKLSKLGFNTETYELKREHFEQLSDLYILEILSIVMFDVFGLTGKKKMNIIVL